MKRVEQLGDRVQTQLRPGRKLGRQGRPLRVGCFDDPTTPRREFTHASAHLGTHPHVGDREPQRRRRSVHERLVVEDRWIMDEHGDGFTAVLDDGDCSPVAPSQSLDISASSPLRASGFPPLSSRPPTSWLLGRRRAVAPRSERSARTVSSSWTLRSRALSPISATSRTV